MLFKDKQHASRVGFVNKNGQCGPAESAGQDWLRFLAGLVALVLCATAPTPASFFHTSKGSAYAAPLPIAVSISPQKYILERIAGDSITVTVLVKPGADPHSYEPTLTQMRECAEARIYFTMGVPFEDIWLPRIHGAAENMEIISFIRDIQRSSFTEGSSDKHNHDGDHDADHDADHEVGSAAHNGRANLECGHSHEHNGEDPHVWLSPLLVRDMLPVIVETLGRVMPERLEEFRTNCELFSLELQALHDELKTMFATVPVEQRIFLTFHPSWGYFAHEFDLTELSIEVDGKEPGPRALRGIIDTARAHNLTTIFVEPQFPMAAAKAVAGNIKARVEYLDPLAEDLPGNLRRTATLLLHSFIR
jgi:zinc transport system substrate-binding protein